MVDYIHVCNMKAPCRYARLVYSWSCMSNLSTEKHKLLHIIRYRVKVAFSDRSDRMAPFLSWFQIGYDCDELVGWLEKVSSVKRS